MKTTLPLLLVLVLGAFASAAPARAAATPPGLVSYQGVLRSSSGAPLNGTYDMVFRFVDAPSGGILLLTDLHTGPNGVVVSSGLFTALLGGGTLAPGTEPTILEVFSNHSPVYVEVQVGAETLTPRVQVVSAAYALNAGRLGGLVPGGYLDTSASAQTKLGTLTSSAGLIGNAAGAGNGIDGTTVSGNGVRGTSTGAAGTTYGVYGKTASTEGTGVAGEATAASGNAWGVYGKTASATGVGVLGSALATGGSTEGMRGQNTSPAGKGVVGVAFSTTGATYGVFGESQSPDGIGTYGRATATSGGTTGVGGETYSTLGTGVAGVAHAASGDAWGVYGATTSPAGYGVVSDGDFVATGSKSFFVEHPDQPDRGIRFACIEGGEVGVYQRGTGKLAGGEARIELPAPFPLVATGRVTVDVTALENCAGLYAPAADVSASGFTVRELGGGKSNAAFSYIVMAERKGYAGIEADRPISLAEKILVSKRFTPAQKAALRGALSSQAGGELDASKRGDVYAMLHRGEFEAACDALGGCGVSAAAPEAAIRRDGSAPPISGRAVDASTPPSAETRALVVSGPSDDVVTHPTLPLSQLSELFPVSERVEAGDVVVVDRARDGELRPGSVAADPAVVGVVAGVTRPIAMGDSAPIALAGTVLCKVDADFGAVSAGDLLVMSPTLGHAMRSSAPAAGTIVGKALEALPAGRGTIRVLLTLR